MDHQAEPLRFTGRVALVAPGELFGGVERQLLDLGSALGALMEKPPLLCLFHDQELASRARDARIDTVIVHSRHRYDMRQVSRIVEILNQSNIQLLHCHGYRAMIVASLIPERSKRPVVKTEHGLPEPVSRRPLAAMKVKLNHVHV